MRNFMNIVTESIITEAADPAVVERFIEALDSLSLDPYAYSGRGMYGEQCVAINCHDVSDMWDIAMKAAHEGIDVTAPAVDNMGMGVVLYWRSMKWPEDGSTNY